VIYSRSAFKKHMVGWQYHHYFLDDMAYKKRHKRNDHCKWPNKYDILYYYIYDTFVRDYKTRGPIR
jgi:hypothetical protein